MRLIPIAIAALSTSLLLGAGSFNNSLAGAGLPNNLTVEVIYFNYIPKGLTGKSADQNGNASGDTIDYTPKGQTFSTSRGYQLSYPAGIHKLGGPQDNALWLREDSVAPLRWLAQPAIRGHLAIVGAFPPNIDLHFSPFIEAAFTIQDFNPGTYGGQPFYPNPKYITPYTARRLITLGWGSVLSTYEQQHHLHITPETPRQAWGNNPNDLPNDGTTVLEWQLHRGSTVATDAFDVKVYQSSTQYTGVTSTDMALTNHVSWKTQPSTTWNRPDDVAFLQALNQQMPYWVATSMPPHIGLKYGANLAAAMTIQNFNPGSIGCQPLAPSPNTLTPSTIAWLRQVGWGPQLARYAAQHHLVLPPTK